LCCVAQVSTSGYYDWLKRDKYKDYEDYLIIKEVFDKGKGKRGWRSIQMHLTGDYGVVMNHKKIKRIMKKYGLITKIRKKNPYKMIMKKTQEHRAFGNLLDRNFEQDVPGKVLSTDITYLYFGKSNKAYLQVIKDVATREIVSWELSNNLSMEFVLKSIKKLEHLDEALIHSDQGFHYTNPEYIKRIKDLGLTQSMSRKGKCIDNAPIESFFGHLKDEVDYKLAKTFKNLNDMINTYMNYYNNNRYQWGLKKMTPVQYRNHLLSINP